MIVPNHNPKPRGFTLVEIMIVVAIIGILVAIAVPGWIRARKESQAKACQEAQMKLEGAAVRWGLDQNKEASDTPAYTDLVGANLYLKRTPKCPVGDTPIGLITITSKASCPNNITDHAIQGTGS